MAKAIASWVIKSKWFIIVAALLLVVACGYGLKLLEFTTDYRTFFAVGNPQLQAFEHLQNTYQKSDNVLIILAPSDGNVFTQQTLSVVEWATKEAWQIPYSTRVDSITNYQHTKAGPDDLVVGDLVREADTFDKERIEIIKQIALQEPSLVNWLVSPSGHVTAINVTVQLPGIELTETEKVVAFARNIAAHIEEKNSNIETYITGVIMLNNAFQEASKKDMMSLVPMMFFIVILTIALMLRSVWATIGALIVIIFSIITAMGFTGWLGIKLTPPSASAPTIILTIAVADVVHILVTFLQQMRHGKDKFEAIYESIRINLQPIFLTSLTTTIGFLSMNFSEVPPFHDLGNMVAFGVIAAFLLSVFFLPAFMLILPLKVNQRQTQTDVLMNAIATLVIQRKKPLMGSMVLLILLTAVFIPNNELNDEWVHYFDRSVDFRNDTDFAVENLTGLYNFEYSFETKQQNGISDPDFLNQLDTFKAWALSQPEVIHVNTITDVMKRLNQNLHGDDPTFYHLPEQRELAAQYLLLYELSLPYGLDLNNQINIDKSATRMILTLKNLSTQETLSLEKRMNSWLNENMPDLTFKVASASLMFAHIGARNVNSMLLGTILALVLISLILVVALKSIKMGLISLIPNLMPAAVAFGIWGMLVSEVGMSLAVVAGMTIGIVVDDTVHFLSKYLRGRREHLLPPQEAIRYAFANVGQALAVTTFVLMAGFSILGLSSFSMNADMGILTAVTIAIALLTDFLLLPPLLMLVEKEKVNKT